MNLPQLLDNLNSRDASLREDAERRLRALSPDELMQFALLEQAGYKRWINKAWTKIIVYMIVAYLPIVAMLILVARLSGLPKGMEGTLLAAPLGLTFGFLFVRFRFMQQPRSRHALANVINGMDDVRFVPVLLSMLEGAGCGVAVKSVQEALIRLLPQLRVGQADQWTAKQRQVVLGWLASPLRNFDVSMTAMHTLEQTGGTWAVPAVTNCANIKLKATFWNKQPGLSHAATLYRIAELKQTAQECLPFLEQRQQEAKQSQTLLRASAPVTPSDTLLRPAAPVVQEKGGEQLLRPSADS